MKKIAYLLLLSLAVVACKNTTETNENEATAEAVVEEVSVNYQSFGEQITDEEVLTKDEMIEKYQNLKEGDTVEVKFSSKVNSVCQSKGCWMRLDMGDNESFVKFKDYAFFMPKDIAGQDVIVDGKAFVEQTSVEDLKHFAKDAGKSQEEIDAITEPKLTLSFLSSGVLIPEKQ
ncbi:DUF4920 domain-containing protein [Aureisphaera sp. CAU 1614]|uniref:DUF4920 domain-containing protein n=1 Tax=Halomarinibacterium sedimenti TaxID=2857106 RepID=A0A9X1JXF2_9FLAO|nr:DUF4920 domain-containing protein [Halomarinibacterium sedimenti]MBW2936512.1 DUF4920 domain-containing protein [Halomarinibacterium sedimenti]